MAPSVVQAATGHSAGASSATVTFGTGTTGGNMITVAVMIADSAGLTGIGVSGVTLGGSGTGWSQVFSGVPAGVLPYISSDGWVNAFWVLPSCAAGKTSVQVTLAADQSTTLLSVIAWEISGAVGSAWPADSLLMSYGQENLVTSWASPAIPNSSASSLLLGVYTGIGTSSFTVAGPGSPWSANGVSVINNSGGGIFTRMLAESNPLSSVTSTTFSGTTSPSSNCVPWVIAIPGTFPAGMVTWEVADGAAGGLGATGVWCAPVSVSAAAQAWGAGGGGALGSGGAGGGEYAAEPAASATAGSLYAVSQGPAGLGGTTISATTGGGNSTITIGGTTVTAHGGASLGNGAGTGTASGGQGSTNTTHFSGGNGGTVSSGVHNTGGGASGGTSSAGNPGSSTTGGSGGAAVTGGGPGGAGATSGPASAPASGPGGGGGGGAGSGGAGWAGQLAISYTMPPPRATPIMPNPSWPVIRAAYW